MTDKPKAVLVVGDVMLDSRVSGDVLRVSPEAPIPVMTSLHDTFTPGGAGNVAANLAALGNQTYLNCRVGTDPAATTLETLLREAGVNTNLVRTSEYTTVQKTRFVSGNQQLLRVDAEIPVDLVQPTHTEDVLRALQWLSENPAIDIAAIVVADYAKGMMNGTIVRLLLDISEIRHIPIFVDTKPRNAELYETATLIKPNLKEAMEMCRNSVHPGLADGSPEEDKAMVMCEFLHNQRFKYVVITRAGNGATCYGDGDYFTSTVQKVEVFDVNGAGDTFMAALVDSTLRGFSFPNAVLRANTAATEAVRHHGTFVIDLATLEDAERRRLGSHGKVMSREDAKLAAIRLRAEGRRIVLTNGCFRMIHQGHWSLLNYAKQQGDVLIVAANSDASIRALRGDSTVSVDEATRLEMLASNPNVDIAFLFDDDSAEQVVRDIHPDILVKGGEYRDGGQAVPGADWLAGKGGEVRWAPMVPSIHASDILT